MMYPGTYASRRMALPAAALAALLLAGCSSGYVGESWQCPLTDAGTCDSVAAADPAVPDMDAAGNAVPGEPLWRARASDRPEAIPAREPALPARGPGQALAIRGPGQAPDTPCEANCGGFDPFAWLARLFDPETADREKAATSDPVRLLPAETPAPPAALPAAPESRELLAGGETSSGDHDDLRTDEVVARIWIAPFVDAGGVYREASYVRVVLEPAGWRLGR